MWQLLSASDRRSASTPSSSRRQSRGDGGRDFRRSSSGALEFQRQSIGSGGPGGGYVEQKADKTDHDLTSSLLPGDNTRRGMDRTGGVVQTNEGLGGEGVAAMDFTVATGGIVAAEEEEMEEEEQQVRPPAVKAPLETMHHGCDTIGACGPRCKCPPAEAVPPLFHRSRRRRRRRGWTS